jgi:uncharacterized protein (TIGR02996 family)
VAKSKAKPAAKKPVAKKPVAKKPAAKQPVAKKPAAKKPALAPKLAKSPASVSEAGPLLAQILASPDDRALRTVYADALIDAGDPRGTFVAQQSALDELDPLDERYAPMLASTHRLLAAHGKAWLGGFDERVKIDMIGRDPVGRFANAVFRRGFLHRIAMHLPHIATEWPRLRARDPIAGIELGVGEHIPDSYRRMDVAAEFRVLRVRPDSWFTGHSVGNVLAWGMPQLTSLDLTGCDLGIDGSRILANLETDLATTFDGFVDPPPFADGQLTELVLDSCQIGDDGASLLFAAAHLSSLTRLDLSGCRIVEAATLGALRDAETMRGLRRLALSGNNQLGPSLGTLAGWEVLPRLEAFKLPQSTTPEALAALFPRPSPALRQLELPSGKALGQAPGLFEIAEHLVELDVGTTSLGDERWAELLAAPSAHRLVHLHANGCSLSDDAIEKLVTSPLDRLVTLDLSSNKLTDDGLRTLAAWDGLQHVTHLRLGNNRKVTAAGLAALAASPKLQPSELDVGKLDPAPLRERFGGALVRG